jgi:hypothetical protein
MSGAIPPFPQYAFMAWCSVERSTGATLLLLYLLREEHRLRVSENRVLRGIFGPKREKVAGGWRRMHYEELHNLYALPNTIRVMKSTRMKWVGHVARMEEMINPQYFGWKT